MPAASTVNTSSQFKGMFDRIFLMGVSPITLDDLSSGYNIDWNISTDSRFNAMIGFDETEVRECSVITNKMESWSVM